MITLCHICVSLIYFSGLLSTCVSGKQINFVDDALFNGLSEEGYGTEWMYFPDGNGVPHRISLIEEPTLELRSWSGYRDVQYRLFTKSNPKQYALLNEKAQPYNKTEKIIADNLSNAPIVLVTHGWQSAADTDAVLAIKDSYLATQDINVIAVDWSEYAAYYRYTSVAFETKSIGTEVGKFLDEMGKHYNLDGSNVHLIGHSLGAHVMGNAGSATDLEIGRITGLDPAKPFFESPGRDRSVKLDTSDAKFVDIIHTCGGILGIMTNSGHADFYPNGGAAPQPGCDSALTFMQACSHGRSHRLYAESVRNPKGFPAYQCNNWAEYTSGQCSRALSYMGYGAHPNATGSFYFETNRAAPYGRGN